MNLLLVTTKQYNEYGLTIPSRVVFDKRMMEKKWPIYSNTRNRTKLDIDANILFYISTPQPGGQLVGRAKIDSVKKNVKNNFSLDENGTVEKFIQFKNIQLLDQPVPFKPLLLKLSFCPKNLSKWGIVLMGGTRQINDEDYKIICKEMTN